MRNLRWFLGALVLGLTLGVASETHPDKRAVLMKLGPNAAPHVALPFGGPANDDCTNAQPISVPSVTSGTTIGAANDAATACGGGGSQTAPGVWYEFIGTGTTMRVSTCVGDNGSARFDTRLSVYCAMPDCGECPLLQCLAGNDDGPAASCPGFTSRVDFCSLAGVRYRVLVHGFGSATGDFSLSLATLGVPCSSPIDCLGVPPPTAACCVVESPPFEPGEMPVACFEADEADCLAAGGTPGPVCSTCVTPDGGSVDAVVQPNLAIPDNDPNGVTHTITIAESFRVHDLDVDLGIAHTWVGDLIVEVTSPGGTSLVLWDQVCGSTDNINATADDEGTETLCAPINAGPIDSVFFSPQLAGKGLLRVFDGEDAQGTWTIRVSDNWPGDVGALAQWSLHFERARPFCEPFECP